VTDAAPPFPWKIGEHVVVIGDTGTGKTYVLANGLLPLREYVVVFVTKSDPRDTSLWQRAGYHIIRRAKDIDDDRYSRFVLQPRYSQQAVEGWRLLERIYRQGRWTVCIDEFMLAERLGLKEQIERLHTQGRSDGISVVVGQQRPVVTSRFAISQSTHVITFRVEGRDAVTLSEATSPRLLPLISEKWRAAHPVESRAIPELREHEFAYYHRGRRFVGRGNARAISRLILRPGVITQKSDTESLDTVTS
jgi:DNA helicase HerA-like ATPase